MIQVLKIFSLSILLGHLSSCITVNVNFPEAAVQQASDSYVEQLYRLKEEAEKQKEGGESKTAKPATQGSLRPSFIDFLLIPEAHAMGEFKIQSELITQIQSREAGRLNQMEKFKKEGFLGESNKGLLVLRGEPKALQKKRLEQLINEENTDRELLYREVLRINGMDKGQMKAVTAKFAVSFQSKSPAGTWIQDTAGQWKQK